MNADDGSNGESKEIITFNVGATEAPDTFKATIELTPSRSANSVITALEVLPPTTERNDLISVWQTMGKMKTEDLRLELVRLSNPSERAGPNFRNLTREQAVEITNQELSSRSGRYGIYWQVAIGVALLLGGWLLGKIV